MALAAIAVAAILPTTSPVEANNYTGANGTTTNCTTNNMGVNGADANPHTFFYSALEPATRKALEWARTDRLNPTSIDTLLLSSVSSTTDVVAYDQDYATYCFWSWHPTGVTAGLVNCVSLTGQACEKHELRMDTSWVDARTENDHNTVACHEELHTWGMTHRDDENGCMRSETPFAGELTLHDVTHINGAPYIKPDYGNTFIYNGQSMKSYDGSKTAVMQSDGNFVIYGSGPYCANNVCYATGTNGAYGSNTWVQVQGDGNFVLYRTDGWGTWTVCNTRTNGHPGMYADMQTDGNLVLYKNVPGGRIVLESSESVGGLCA